MLLETYEEGRLLSWAKGWKLDAVAKEISEVAKKRPELERFKCSLTTFSLLSKTAQPLPPPVAEVIEGLESHKPHLSEIVEAGLRKLRGQSQPKAKKDPRKMAQALLDNFPTDEVALKLAA